MMKVVTTVLMGMLCLALAQVAVAGEEKPAVVDTYLVDQLAQLEGAAPAAGDAVLDAVATDAAAEEAAPDALPEQKINSAVDLASMEEVKRQADEVEARLALEKADAARAKEDYSNALPNFKKALLKFPIRPLTAAERERARQGIVECEYELGRKRLAENDWDGAIKSAEEALKLDQYHQPSKALIEQAEKGRADEAERERIDARIVKKREPVVTAKKTVADLLDEGRQYLDLGRLDDAKERFESVLALDPYNRRAMGLLKQINERKYRAHTRGYETTAEGMLQEVRQKWSPPVTQEIIRPETRKEDVERQSILASKRRLREKMERIVVPSLEFRQANIHDVVQFLQKASVMYDQEPDPDQKGVNIILNLNLPGSGGGAAGPAAAAPEGWGVPAAEEPAGLPALGAATGAAVDVPHVTLILKRINLLDAIKYITELTNLKYRIEENVVMIVPAGVVTGRTVTRMYPVQPTFGDLLRTTMESEGAGGAAADPFGGLGVVRMGREIEEHKLGEATEFFKKMGVPFPIGTSCSYNAGISKLIVVNTPENLEIFEEVLGQLDIQPKQVEIEARFVEIGQEDLEELGLEWLLTDSWEIAQKAGMTGAPLGSRQRVVMEQNNLAGGFTRVNRAWERDAAGALLAQASGTVGSILSIASVLTNPELKLIVHAMDQSGKANLLSAPKVTTRSGQNATIKVVTEYIYPTEYETDNVGGSFGGFDFGDTIGMDPDEVQQLTRLLPEPIVAVPAAFETRETGVILNVTPTVGTDGYTIDLIMQPEVAELVDWISYGTIAKVDMKQPVFSSRNVTTQIVIWDGQTVVMGGLIRENMKTIEDKIPILGHIPLIGRLFRNEGENSQKQNLLIFVTARLVDPAGKPIHRAKVKVKEAAPATAAAAAK
ncbi:MAG: hypothetical protein JXR37_33385 [Kiritimatiellae bacterium]|nr:hypothetical protein [Kiritimatiellia bacterium]